MQKSMLFYSLLILSIFVTTVVASGVSIITYKKKIKAEERTKHLENQQRLEHEIEVAKDYLENIVENTRTNLMVVDKDLRVRTLNTAQALILNHRKQDILGKPFFSLFPMSCPHNGIHMVTILQKPFPGAVSRSGL
jgi:transcriptional regulator with PAS, ATPase and Fis domain